LLLQVEARGDGRRRCIAFGRRRASVGKLSCVRTQRVRKAAPGARLRVGNPEFGAQKSDAAFVPMECIMDMLLIISFMSFIMPVIGMSPMPPIMPAPPCGAALADGLGGVAGAGVDFPLSAAWE
jgi:hypothetical protein